MIGAVIQARMASTRLPGKVLMDLCGKPVLQRVIERVKAIEGLDVIVVATYASEENRPICQVATACGVEYFFYSGDESDVLARYKWAADWYDLDTIVRITADCPLLDPVISSNILKLFKRHGFQYVSNTIPPTFPDGMDTEVFTAEALRMAYKEATLPYDREHVTPWIKDHLKPKYRFNYVNSEDKSHIRLTLDTAEDLESIRNIYSQIDKDIFSLDEILSLDKFKNL